MPSDPPSRPKKFFWPLCDDQNFLELRSEPVKFWAGSAPDKGENKQTIVLNLFNVRSSGKDLNRCLPEWAIPENIRTHTPWTILEIL